MPAPKRRPPQADLPAREVFTYAAPMLPEMIPGPDGDLIVKLDDDGETVYSNAPKFPGVYSIGVVVLTPNEEKTAMRRCQNDPPAMAYELAKAAMVEFNGKPLVDHDGSKDKAFSEMGPKGRRLLLEAYGDLTGVEDDDVTGFLASRRVKA